MIARIFEPADGLWGSIFCFGGCGCARIVTLCDTAVGFLVYNWAPARVFMGDVGSAFLGFVFAVLAIIAARYDSSHTSFLVMPLLLFNFMGLQEVVWVN